MEVVDVSKLAQNAKEAHSGEEALGKVKEPVLEPKLDGIRVLCHITEAGTRMYSRGGNRKDQIPHIGEELAAAFPVGTWLDAEAVAFNEDGSQNWGGAQSVMGATPGKDPAAIANMRLVVFDILSYGDKDARGATLKDRRTILETIFAGDTGATFSRVMLVCQMEATQENHDELVAAGYEGSMIKDLTSTYQSDKRVWGWTKIKLIETVDVVITNFTPGKGKFVNQIGAIVFGQYDEAGLFHQERGKCSGMDDAFRLKLTQEGLDVWEDKVIEISFRTSMTDKKTGLPNYRHPQFERVRWDKDPRSCIVERKGA